MDNMKQINCLLWESERLFSWDRWNEVLQSSLLPSLSQSLSLQWNRNRSLVPKEEFLIYSIFLDLQTTRSMTWRTTPAAPRAVPKTPNCWPAWPIAIDPIITEKNTWKEPNQFDYRMKGKRNETNGQHGARRGHSPIDIVSAHPEG